MLKRLIPIALILLFASSIPAEAKVEKKDRLWQDESIYSIMIDRFNNGDTHNDIDVNTKDLLAYSGGDIQGVIDKLDYIQDMGFTTIRLTPVFDNAKGGYHGYWITDFYKIDEHFGTIKTLQKLVKEAHKRKIKVLLDFVTNNVAAGHPWLTDPGKQNWFHAKQEIVDWTNQKQLEAGWVEGLPDLNQNQPEVRDYLIDAAKWWIKKTNIDGYSLPEVNHVPISFWHDFSAAVKKEKKNFFLLGIPSQSTVIGVKKYEDAGINSVLDISRSEDLRQVFATTDQSLPARAGKSEQSEGTKVLTNFLDNENTVRFTHDIVAKRQFPGTRWKTALTYLYTTPGIPIVFYGTEIAQNGGKVPDNRKPMNFRAEKELIEYMTKVSQLRNDLPSLTRGSFDLLYNKEGLIIYKRVYKDETAVIAINNTSKSQKVTLTANDIEGGKELRGLLDGDLVSSHKGQYLLILDRDISEVYVLTKKSGLNFPMISAMVMVVILVLIFLFFILKRGKPSKIG
ncbi:alpha-amylase family glycosyl hydrolase [Bacillus rubiinfantis]|uniref:alpha-amylase family glycosyl hydrolase n=1 Tax=Bacillus rubiinfantis TaxID=1499680 RepID=UPI0005A967CA|nr:alpha-amylase family glycosyl hydrolase [Bacillus rubiinfantis]